MPNNDFKDNRWERRSSRFLGGLTRSAAFFLSRQSREAFLFSGVALFSLTFYQLFFQPPLYVQGFMETPRWVLIAFIYGFALLFSFLPKYRPYLSALLGRNLIFYWYLIFHLSFASYALIGYLAWEPHASLDLLGKIKKSFWFYARVFPYSIGQALPGVPCFVILYRHLILKKFFPENRAGGEANARYPKSQQVLETGVSLLAVALTLGALVASDRNPGWEHERQIHQIYQDYDPSIEGSKADVLYKSQRKQRKDFFESVGGGSENPDAMDPSHLSRGGVPYEKLTIEARQAYDRLDLRFQHEVQDLKLEKRQRLDREMDRYKLNQQLTNNEITDEDYDKKYAESHEMRNNEWKLLKDRQHNERERQDATQRQARENAGRL